MNEQGATFGGYKPGKHHDAFIRQVVQRVAQGEPVDAEAVILAFEGLDPTKGHLTYGDPLGTGSFGTVTTATVKWSGKEYAVKVPHKSQPTSPQLTEMEAYSRMEAHPNLVGCVSMNDRHRQVPILFELCDGGDMSSIVSGKVLVDLHCKLELLAEVAAGLAHVHKYDIVHQDLKPSNVLLKKKKLQEGSEECPFTAKLGDFGLASSVGTMRNRRGTMGYIPPESVSAPEPCGVDQDTYAFGVLLMHIMAKPECLNPMIFMSKDLLKEEDHAAYAQLTDAKSRVEMQIDIMVRNMKDEGSLDKLLTTEIFPESIANLSVFFPVLRLILSPKRDERPSMETILGWVKSLHQDVLANTQGQDDRAHEASAVAPAPAGAEVSPESVHHQPNELPCARNPAVSEVVAAALSDGKNPVFPGVSSPQDDDACVQPLNGAGGGGSINNGAGDGGPAPAAVGGARCADLVKRSPGQHGGRITLPDRETAADARVEGALTGGQMNVRGVACEGPVRKIGQEDLKGRESSNIVKNDIIRSVVTTSDAAASAASAAPAAEILHSSPQRQVNVERHEDSFSKYRRDNRGTIGMANESNRVAGDASPPNFTQHHAPTRVMNNTFTNGVPPLVQGLRRESPTPRHIISPTRRAVQDGGWEGPNRSYRDAVPSHRQSATARYHSTAIYHPAVKGSHDRQIRTHQPVPSAAEAPIHQAGFTPAPEPSLSCGSRMAFARNGRASGAAAPSVRSTSPDAMKAYCSGTWGGTTCAPSSGQSQECMAAVAAATAVTASSRRKRSKKTRRGKRNKKRGSGQQHGQEAMPSMVRQAAQAPARSDRNGSEAGSRGGPRGWTTAYTDPAPRAEAVAGTWYGNACNAYNTGGHCAPPVSVPRAMYLAEGAGVYNYPVGNFYEGQWNEVNVGYGMRVAAY